MAGSSFIYDKNGNLTSDGLWTYTYDTEDHLTSASKAGTSVTYAYDPFKRRKSKTVGGTAITLYASYGVQELTEYAGTVGQPISWSKRFIYGPGLDEPVASYNPAGVLLYQFADVQGSVTDQINTAGQVTAKHGYTAYRNRGRFPLNFRALPVKSIPSSFPRTRESRLSMISLVESLDSCVRGNDGGESWCN